jgi:hypothetical protein
VLCSRLIWRTLSRSRLLGVWRFQEVGWPDRVASLQGEAGEGFQCDAGS